MSAHARGVQLEVLHTADIPTPYGYVFRAPGSRLHRLRAGLDRKGQTIRSPCLAYVVRHPHAGVLLLDTGLHPDASSDLRKDFGLAMGLLFRDLDPAPTPFVEQLRAVGVEADDVERVVMTHLHVDHTSGMRLLPNARFVCTRREWGAAHRRLATAGGYARHHLPPASRMQLLDYEEQGEPYDTFSQTIDLLGDGTVRLISTPGHTAGHQSVLLELEGGRTVLLVGDASYTLRSIREELLPMATASDEDSRRSLRELHAFATAHPEAPLVPSHDPEAWLELRAATAGARPVKEHAPADQR